MTIRLVLPPPKIVAPSIWLIWDVVKVMYFVFLVGGSSAFEPSDLRTIVTEREEAGSDLTSVVFQVWLRMRGCWMICFCTWMTFWGLPPPLEFTTRTTFMFEPDDVDAEFVGDKIRMFDVFCGRPMVIEDAVPTFTVPANDFSIFTPDSDGELTETTCPEEAKRDFII